MWLLSAVVTELTCILKVGCIKYLSTFEYCACVVTGFWSELDLHHVLELFQKLIMSDSKVDIDCFISVAIMYLKLGIEARPFQKQVIENYITGRDCFCIAGTGAGKSLTYTLAPVIFDLKKGILPSKCEDTCIINHAVVIIQPLKSLMKSQRDKLLSLGLKALYVGDEDSGADINDMKDYNYIIASPESAISEKFLTAIRQLKKSICCVFVDESHCVQTL